MSQAEQITLLLIDATRLMRKRFNRRAVAMGLSATQWRLLAVTMREGSINQARLAERLEIEPISVSRLIDRMEEAGWVRREADPADRRSKCIVPSDRALARREEIRAMVCDITNEGLRGIDPTDIGPMAEALKKMIANYSEAEASSAEPEV